MIKIKVKKLDHESFRPYGDFVALIRPDEHDQCMLSHDISACSAT